MPAFLVALGSISLAAPGATETPAQAVDRIWVAWDDGRAGDDKATAKKFLQLSQEIAHEQGTAIIPAILARAKDWTGEEVLIYLAVFADLPREKALPILTKYRDQGEPWERQAADDVLIELDSADFKAGMKEMQNP